jgi:2-methylcitrate dehydratase PrpD
MSREEVFAKFIHEAEYEDLPQEIVDMVKRQIVATWAATIAGKASAGIPALAEFAVKMGGREEASIVLYGNRVPAQQAAFVNGSMARAWDIDDHRSPGVHIGSACIPAAFAAAELVGGCSGKDIITAIAVGVEVSLRLNLEEGEYAGFDPTGINAVFATTAAVSWILKPDEREILQALALAFNKCGGSFQSNTDGSLAVRVIEGWCAETGVLCARLAQLGITGPHNFLDGVYGYFFLYGRDKAESERAKSVEDIGTVWHLSTLSFKKYPSCGQTQGSTQLALDLMNEHGFTGDDVEYAEVIVSPFTYKLVGKYELGANPKVNAQFGVAYCVANALCRAPVTLLQFEEAAIRDPDINRFIEERVRVVSDDARFVNRGHYASDLHIVTKDGRDFFGSVDIPPGTPGYPMTEDEHTARFYDCVEVSGLSWIGARADEILRRVRSLDSEENALDVLALLIP